MADRIRLRTREREELVDITEEVNAAVRRSGVGEGLAYIWSLHTTCSVTVNEGADPDVARDLVVALAGLAPRQGDYLHAEGNSDAHVKTSLFGPGMALIVEDGAILLGTWQRVFLAEWDGPRERTLVVRVFETE
ncbi:MAG TPA: secondary thiamine-phosphate synthase enzyme YjbQ [Longimicrobiales bacterium]|nr:secondary thiamine-phosphate synthase enzyme YjbQ [Longimicrobiales bacterium]